LPETEVLEPGRDVHGRLHSARPDQLVRLVVCKATTNRRRADGGPVAQPSHFANDRIPAAHRPFLSPIL
jgi:hypothetical protein